MRAIRHRLEFWVSLPVVRYAINGLVATAVHFGVLELNIQILGFSSFGLANFIAVFFGIAASFIGSRYFVFTAQGDSIFRQVFKFAGLYTAIAFLNGGVLYAWSDIQGWDYRIGFILATMLQVVLSYWGNKLLVFK